MKENDERIEETFTINYKAAKKIIDQYGFPTYSMVGKESSHKFWEMVQHFDHDVLLQQTVVRMMDRAIKQNDASVIDFAYLSDRVLINLGREQNFGTQIKYNFTKKTYVPLKIENIEVVNVNRAKIGLPPLKEYIAQMNAKYDGSIPPKPKKRNFHDAVGRPKHVIERLRNN